jgi:hypothetical protein
MSNCGRGHRGRALLAGLVIGVSVLVIGVVPAPAQAVPELMLHDTFAPEIFSYTDCDGTVHRQDDLEGLVQFTLSEPPTAGVTIPMTYSGDLADDLVDPPGELTFGPDDVDGDLRLTFDVVIDGSLTVTPQPGPGYVVSPDLAPTIVVDGPVTETRCDSDLGSPPDGDDRQTITVGERPNPIGFVQLDDEVGGQANPHGYSTPVSGGTVPPGLTYDTDIWSGAATTPGTYDFDVRLCQPTSRYLPFGDGPSSPAPTGLPDTICFGTIDVRVVVEAAGGQPPGGPGGPSAPPATPVRTAARLTG